MGRLLMPEDLPTGCARFPSVLRKLGVLLIVVAALGGGSARGGGSPVALVTAETQNALLAISLPDGRVLKRLRMPADPQNVAVVGGTRAVVVSPRAGAVTVVSTPSLQIVRVLRGFVSPHIVIATADFRGAYVTDPMRPKVVGRFDPGFAAHDVAFSSDWRVWVTAADRRFVTIFDSRTRRPVARVPAGAPPQHVAFGPIRGAFVTSGYGSSPELVDPFSRPLPRTVHVPDG